MTDCGGYLGSARRFYLSRRRRALEEDDPNAAVWQAKQEAEPGTALAPTFPALDELEAAGYTTVEDLTGATEDELLRAGLSLTNARAALAALE